MAEDVNKIKLESGEHDAVIGVSIFRQIGHKKEVLIVQGPSGKWYFPGGKQRKGENLEMCVRRELKEELGLEFRGSLYGFSMGSYKIGRKNLAIANVVLDHDMLLSEPRLQHNDAVRAFQWTDNPLEYDLTEQARYTLTHQMNSSLLIEKK